MRIIKLKQNKNETKVTYKKLLKIINIYNDFRTNS